MEFLIDSYSEIYNDFDFTPIKSTSTNIVGQTFKSQIVSKLIRSELYIRQFGTVSGNAVAKLYAMTGTYGTNGKPTGSALATSDAVDSSLISNSYSLVSFTFSTPYYFAEDTNYCVALDATSVLGTGRLEWGEDVSSPTHRGNQFNSSNGGTSYGTSSAKDFCFYVYGFRPYASKKYPLADTTYQTNGTRNPRVRWTRPT